MPMIRRDLLACGFLLAAAPLAAQPTRVSPDLLRRVTPPTNHDS